MRLIISCLLLLSIIICCSHAKKKDTHVTGSKKSEGAITKKYVNKDGTCVICTLTKKLAKHRAAKKAKAAKSVAKHKAHKGKKKQFLKPKKKVKTQVTDPVFRADLAKDKSREGAAPPPAKKDASKTAPPPEENPNPRKDGPWTRIYLEPWHARKHYEEDEPIPPPADLVSLVKKAGSASEQRGVVAPPKDHLPQLLAQQSLQQDQQGKAKVPTPKLPSSVVDEKPPMLGPMPLIPLQPIAQPAPVPEIPAVQIATAPFAPPPAAPIQFAAQGPPPAGPAPLPQTEPVTEPAARAPIPLPAPVPAAPAPAPAVPAPPVAAVAPPVAPEAKPMDAVGLTLLDTKTQIDTTTPLLQPVKMVTIEGASNPQKKSAAPKSAKKTRSYIPEFVNDE